MGEQVVVFVVYRQTKLKMNNKMKVSIIVPVYNVAEYITECFNSVASQTFTGGMECIFVDDCGTDDSVDIVRSLISLYHGNVRFRVVNHDHNKGLSAARNTGLREAKGEYLYFLDSDDYITPECIQCMWAMVDRFPCVECVFGGANVIGEGYKWLDYTKKILPDYTSDRDWLQESMLKRYELSMTAWNRLISASFVKQHNLYFEEGLIHEDELWNLAISQVITNAAFIKVNTYNYIIRENSIMTGINGSSTLFLQRHFRLWNKMIDQIKGYRKGIQAYYIVLFLSEGLEKISTFIEYLKFMRVLLRAIFKSEGQYRFSLMRTFLGFNKYFLKRCLKMV